ncbi:MAG TPA: response regulator [Chitinophagaceae bacterium]|nr:response regulator [Chitinophagaceae bacterium]
MTSTNINILLADDDKDDCLFFKEALEEIQIPTQLTVVHDGEQLMDMLIKKCKEVFHVLFIDLNMPRKNGFTCLQEIKSDPNLKHLPVIIFSTSYDEKNANLLSENGAQHYICKPADFSELKKVIHQALSLLSLKKMKQPNKDNFLLNHLKAIIL